jgi:hypothetical protein
MCVTDLDLEIAEDEQAPLPGQPENSGRYAGVAWGLAERHDDQDDHDDHDDQDDQDDHAQAGLGAARSR